MKNRDGLRTALSRAEWKSLEKIRCTASWKNLIRLFHLNRNNPLPLGRLARLFPSGKIYDSDLGNFNRRLREEKVAMQLLLVQTGSRRKLPWEKRFVRFYAEPGTVAFKARSKPFLPPLPKLLSRFS